MRSIVYAKACVNVYQPATSGLLVIRPEQGILAIAEANRELVADQPAAAVGEDRRTAGNARPLLLAAVGGEPSDAAPVWKPAAADGGIAGASRISGAARRNQSGRRRGVEGEVSEKSLRNGANHGLLVLAKDLPGAPDSLALGPMQKKIAAAATGSILSPPGKQNGYSG
jgi:hypothetical protein